MFPLDIKTVSGSIVLDGDNQNEVILEYDGSVPWTLLSLRTWGDQMSGELAGNPLYVTIVSDDTTFLQRIVPVLESTISGAYVDYPPTQFYPYQEFSDDIVLGAGAMSLGDPVGLFNYQLTYIEHPYNGDSVTPFFQMFSIVFVIVFFLVWLFRTKK